MIYTIRPHTGPDAVGRTVDCEDDQQAMDRAERMAEAGHVLQVWADRRLVGSVYQTFGRAGEGSSPPRTEHPMSKEWDALTPRHQSLVQCLLANSGLLTTSEFNALVDAVLAERTPGRARAVTHPGGR